MVATVLPAAIRPTSFLESDLYAYAGTVGAAEIDSQYGNIYMGAGATPAAQAAGQQFTSLAGLSYPAAPANWQPLTLLDGWQGCCAVPLSYEVEDYVVYLEGAVEPGSNTGELLTVLPPAARPSHTLYISVYGNDGAGPASLQINPDGSIDVFGPIGPSGIWIGGISYHTGP